MSEAHEYFASIPAHAKWCQPGDRQDKRHFIVRFDDPDRGDAVFTDEAEARDFYARATLSWNCWLFGALPARPDGMTPLDWMRLGARAARLSAGAQCGNHWESAQEDAMTSSGLSGLDKQKLYAEAKASEEIREHIDGTCEDAALGYTAYMGSEADRTLLAAAGVTSDWHYRREVGVPSRMEQSREADGTKPS